MVSVARYDVDVFPSNVSFSPNRHAKEDGRTATAALPRLLWSGVWLRVGQLAKIWRAHPGSVSELSSVILTLEFFRVRQVSENLICDLTAASGGKLQSSDAPNLISHKFTDLVQIRRWGSSPPPLPIVSDLEMPSPLERYCFCRRPRSPVGTSLRTCRLASHRPPRQASGGP